MYFKTFYFEIIVDLHAVVRNNAERSRHFPPRSPGYGAGDILQDHSTTPQPGNGFWCDPGSRPLSPALPALSWVCTEPHHECRVLRHSQDTEQSGSAPGPLCCSSEPQPTPSHLSRTPMTADLLSISVILLFQGVIYMESHSM